MRPTGAGGGDARGQFPWHSLRVALGVMLTDEDIEEDRKDGLTLTRLTRRSPVPWIDGCTFLQREVLAQWGARIEARTPADPRLAADGRLPWALPTRTWRTLFPGTLDTHEARLTDLKQGFRGAMTGWNTEVQLQEISSKLTDLGQVLTGLAAYWTVASGKEVIAQAAEVDGAGAGLEAARFKVAAAGLRQEAGASLSHSYWHEGSEDVTVEAATPISNPHEPELARIEAS